MRTAYLDMFSGVAGDMLLGACLDAGVALDELREALEPLELDGVTLAAERVERHGIGATRCLVEVPDRAGHRAAREILDRIEGAGLPDPVALRAAEVFRRMAAAEAKVHDTTPDEVHFHEVGALDAIVDVVGGVWCLDRLGIERLHASPFTLGRGWVEAAHGTLPVPAPAVLELVAGWPVVEGRAPVELTTPTGAALVTTLAEGRGVPADFVVEATAYGAATRELEEQPNVLRLVVGTVAAGAESLAVVECDVDDLDPRLLEPTADALVAAGAREVHWIPVQMKKRRAGVTIKALVPVPAVGEVGEALFRETTTIGYRWWPVAREILAREIVEIETSYGRVAVKRIHRRDGTREARPEYDDCRRIATERGLPTRVIVDAIEAELAGRDDHREGR